MALCNSALDVLLLYNYLAITQELILVVDSEVGQHAVAAFSLVFAKLCERRSSVCSALHSWQLLPTCVCMQLLVHMNVHTATLCAMVHRSVWYMHG